MPFECAEKNALRDPWHKCAFIYAKAVREFSDKVGLAISDDLDFLQIKAEQAKIIAAYTRERYESHMNQHGC